MGSPLLWLLLGILLGLMLTVLRRRSVTKPAPETAPARSERAPSAFLRADDEHLLRQILTRAEVLLWWGTVRRDGDTFQWKIEVPTELADRSLMRWARARRAGGLWEPEFVPELPEMSARAEAALKSGSTGYRHEFRVLTEAGPRWLSEDVSIEPRSADEWGLSGVVVDVTARREAEDARRSTELRLQHILQRADCLIWHARVDTLADGSLRWRTSFAPSDLHRRVFGRLLGEDELDVFAGVEVPEAEEIHARSAAALRNGAPGYTQEYRVIRAGQTCWLSEQVSVRASGPGQWEVVGVSVDVTARRSAEEARRATEVQFEQLLRRADCLVWQARVVAEEDGSYTWSETFFPRSALDRRIYGERPSNRPGIWEPHRAPDFAAMSERSASAFRRGESGYEQEFRFLGQDQVFWLHEQVTIMPEGPGRWSCVGVVVDVTARRLAEQALAAEKERLNVTLQAMDEGVITTDGTGAVQFMNRAAETLTGRSAAAMIGRGIDEVCPLYQEDGDKDSGWPLMEVGRDGRVVDLPPGVVMRGLAGARAPVEGCAAPVRDAQGAVNGAVVVFRDVTERHRLKSELQRASKLESIGILAGGIAHDFNNILTGVMGNIALAALDAESMPAVQQSLQEAERACIRARDLTQQLLTFAKGGDPIRTALHLPAIIRECAQFALHGSRATIEFELGEDLWLANADRGQVGQIVQNLVINAVQAMPGGGVIRVKAINVAIGVGGAIPLLPGDYLQLSITDNGVGIAPQDLGKVFDPYFTTKKQGSGLGLATVHSIVHRHGGHVSVESELGRGTTFHIWLPALREGAVKNPAPESATGSGLRGRVLVMDDEAPVRLAAARLAQRLGLEAETVPDGGAAIARCRETCARGEPFDVVVMDLTVPGGIGGADALVEIRRFHPAVKAVVSSGYSSDPVMGNYRAYGFDALVAKPYSYEEFANVLRGVLEPAARREFTRA